MVLFVEVMASWFTDRLSQQSLKNYQQTCWGEGISIYGLYRIWVTRL